MHHNMLLNFNDEIFQNHLELEHCIPTELRYLKWEGFPFEFLPLNSQEYYKLIGLHLCHSNLTQFWIGKKHLDELKYINLNHSRKLFKTPNFAEIPNLERLELEGCTSLINIHPSIFVAKKLVFLSLKDCINLTNLPTHINIKVLQVLILSGCSKLEKIPQFSGNTDRLLQLHLDNTTITKLPLSFASLNHLTLLSLRNCKQLFVPFSTTVDSCCDVIRRLFHCFCKAPTIGIPPLSAGLYSLTKLDLRDCNLKEIPHEIECLVSLTELNLSGNNFSRLPTSISRLRNLKRLNINKCKKLVFFPTLPPRILRLVSKDCVSVTNIPDISKVENLYFVTELNLMNCYQLGDNEGFYRLMISWMEKMYFRKGTFNIMIPGREIPDWFTTTNMGSSISVKWDPNAPNANMIRFALCVICGCATDDDRVDDMDDVSGSIIASVSGKSYQDSNLKKGDLIVNGFTISGMRKLDHIWLFVLPRAKSLTRKINSCTEIEFRFLLQLNYRQGVSSNIKLKKCGVGLINMEEEKEAMKRYASHIILKNKMRLRTM